MYKATDKKWKTCFGRNTSEYGLLYGCRTSCDGKNKGNSFYGLREE